MSLFVQLYTLVRDLGLPYKISESGGSVVIKISSNSNQKQLNLPKEKFRFHSIRTLNGSDNLNWRRPNTYQEASFAPRSTSFPDISFFRDTPAPPPQCPAPPPRALPQPPPPAVKSQSSLESPIFSYTNQPNNLITSTALNPFRCSRRHIDYPQTPNLLNPLVTELPDSHSPASSLPTTIALDMSCENTEFIGQAGIEAFRKVFQAIYEKK